MADPVIILNHVMTSQSWPLEFLTLSQLTNKIKQGGLIYNIYDL